MVQRIFLYFFDKKREGLAFERLKFASSTPEHPRHGVLKLWKLLKECQKQEKTRGRVFVGLDLVDYSDESEDEAYGEYDKGNKVYFVHFFVNQINADIAWDTAEKPEKASALLKPGDGFGAIKAVISNCFKD